MFLKKAFIVSLAGLVTASQESLQLVSKGQYVPSTVCFDSGSSLSFLNIKEPSLKLSVPFYEPIRSSKNDEGIPSISVLVYEETVLDKKSISWCDKSSVEAGECQKDGVFSYNAKGKAEELLLGSEEQQLNLKPAKYCVTAMDPEAISFDISVSVLTASGLTKGEIFTTFGEFFDFFMDMLMALFIKFAWSRKALGFPFLIKSMSVFYLLTALVHLINGYEFLSVTRFDLNEGILAVVADFTGEALQFAQRLFFFLSSGGMFYSSYDKPAIADIKVPAAVFSLLAGFFFLFKRFPPVNFIEIACVVVLALYTLFRFYKTRSALSEKQTMDYKRFVWTTLFNYFEGPVTGIVGGIMATIFIAANGNFLPDENIVPIASAAFLMSVLLRVAFMFIFCHTWVPAEKYQPVALSPDIEMK